VVGLLRRIPFVGFSNPIQNDPCCSQNLSLDARFTGTIHGRKSEKGDVGTVGKSKNLLALHDVSAAACD
jgi:hypothetical protein